MKTTLIPTRTGGTPQGIRRTAPLRDVALDAKYLAADGSIFLTGTQALVRLPLLQRDQDAQRGLNTAGFISGYRGSPLGAYDRELWRAKSHLASKHVRFVPGINEELAATAVWGSQQVGLFNNSRYDGVFGLWYGKGAGLDRSGDAIRHANMAGTSPYGGVLAVVGDDHNLKSSSQAAHSEPTFADLQMPVLFPGDLQEIITYGLMGWELSRFSGSWVGLKVLADTMDSSGTITLADACPVFVTLRDASIERPVHIRWPDPWSEGEIRFHRYKLPAIHAFARENGLNQIRVDCQRPRIAIVAAGKSWVDVRQALLDLGLGPRELQDAGIRLVKIAMPWPLEPRLLREFCSDLEEILVIEEKRQLIENQIRSALYDVPDGRRPRVIGQFDEQANEILPRTGEHDVATVARVINARLSRWFSTPMMSAHMARLDARADQLTRLPALSLARTAFFCSGCPHNTSTNIPAGSRAIAGIGCHGMAMFTSRASTFTQMGGEGTNWIGQAPFVSEPHVFSNLGDGTYFHSGQLAIRACVAAGVTMTYKILFNDAVAMTGGQPLDGTLTVPQLSRQLLDEGLAKVVVVAEDPSKYDTGEPLPSGVEVWHRDALDQVQRQLRSISGVTGLIYDQVCAAEKRRRRKRGQLADPPKRIFINRAVCEGCGDCSKTSNCLSVAPIDTEFGRRRQIDQSSCNKDFSCAEGFCPSFVIVEGGRPLSLRSISGLKDLEKSLQVPEIPVLDDNRPYGVLVTGIGGTGVVTVGALIAMAAHLEGNSCRVVDVLGMAQKGGSVVSHLRIAKKIESIAAAKLGAASADVLLGCDALVSAESRSLSLLHERAAAVINSDDAITGSQAGNPDLELPHSLLKARVEAIIDKTRVTWIPASQLATRMFGDSVSSNVLLLGYAWQRGLIPLSFEALDKAIELNGVSPSSNKDAFLIGRIAAALPEQAAAWMMNPTSADADLRISSTLAEAVQRRGAYLTEYQDERYAARFVCLVQSVAKAASAAGFADDRLTKAVAESYFRLLSYKDEYEVARLYTRPEFRQQLAEVFEGTTKVNVLLAPPLLSRPNRRTGLIKKRRYGPWIFTVFRLLTMMRGLRNTPFDPFGYTDERRQERALISDFERTVARITGQLNPNNYEVAIEIGTLPQGIRGYGAIKRKTIDDFELRSKVLTDKFLGLRATTEAHQEAATT